MIVVGIGRLVGKQRRAAGAIIAFSELNNGCTKFSTTCSPVGSDARGWAPTPALAAVGNVHLRQSAHAWMPNRPMPSPQHADPI
jgi:hypothetical protein